MDSVDVGLVDYAAVDTVPDTDPRLVTLLGGPQNPEIDIALAVPAGATVRARVPEAAQVRLRTARGTVFELPQKAETRAARGVRIEAREEPYGIGRKDVDPSSPEPVFFLSYAHASRVPGNEETDPDAAVRRLFFDLSNHLDQLVSKDSGIQVGAMDRTMGGNERWSRKLLRELGTCHVFVALTSPPYFNSTWCGMEWGVFESRTAAMEIVEADEEHKPPVDTALLPVRWVRTERRRTPKVNQAIQEFAPVSGGREESLYKQHGLYGLSRSSRYRDVYESVVWELAQRIAQIYYEVTIPDLIHDNHENLPNAFKDTP